MTRAGERLIKAAEKERDRLADFMALDAVVVDMVARTVETGGEVLPIAWWGDAGGDPCPLDTARLLSAGPDVDGLFVQVSLDLIGRRTQ